MNWKDIRVGIEVTWNTGDIRAKIVGTQPSEQLAKVELARDYVTPCGHHVPKGMTFMVPAFELRPVV